jgi:hypothetical protein
MMIAAQVPTAIRVVMMMVVVRFVMMPVFHPERFNRRFSHIISDNVAAI